MKKVIFAGIAVAMLTACSNDEFVLENNEANAISFGVTTENSSRAENVYCNVNLPEFFNVSAIYNEAVYFNGDIVNKQGDDTWKMDGVRYWPNTGDVYFYGYLNGNITLNGKNAPKFENFKVIGDVDDTEKAVKDQVDLLYAVKKQAKAEGTQVNLNFRHALSQIVFNARNDNDKLYVEISGVKVVNVSNEGTYTFPTVNTNTNIDHNNPSADVTDNSRGTWANFAGKATYEVSFDAKPIAGNGQAVDLTTYKHTGKDAAFANAMMLIPQETEATVVKEGQKINKEVGTYFLVNCQIWNVADPKAGVNKDNDVVLWGKEGATEVLLPVDFNWDEGKKYTYTFVFGKGNGGYNPDPDPDDPDPDPVLVPITFNVDIDEFIPVEPSTEIETFKPETGDNTENTGENA